jgi:hypothetical protein
MAKETGLNGGDDEATRSWIRGLALAAFVSYSTLAVLGFHTTRPAFQRLTTEADLPPSSFLFIVPCFSRPIRRRAKAGHGSLKGRRADSIPCGSGVESRGSGPLAGSARLLWPAAVGSQGRAEQSVLTQTRL